MEKINRILEELRGELTPAITRHFYKFNIDFALQVIEAMGKRRNASFVIDKDNKFVYENLIRWVHGDSEMKSLHPETRKIIPGELTKGIYIAGNTGTGKSWALDLILLYTKIDEVRVTFREAHRRLTWKNTRSDVICDEYALTGNSDSYKTTKILGIQDFGSEPNESLFMGNRINVMKQIIEYRGDRDDQITLITSNLPILHKSTEQKYGDRVTSRLLEMCNYFELKGQDRRKNSTRSPQVRSAGT